ncbi:subunit 1 of aminodeoxychorismate synthase [Vitreoscilla sp. C1]|uniref:bifunctional chorismate-binding protein/class IV aminotransferase n=1 Tax=Vitreoscilla sp. (strain C1) TaxID=96942 RepID=UPI00148EB2EF|nr:bifunctional chorismate-binding protein/class IV aminotransferase [Vitreoscilla sp. C1]AUZ05631.2 subunit 1 of aminodeoxychorismate synthase [Vitreoscilla sp. C1]
MKSLERPYFVVLDDAQTKRCRYYQNWVGLDTITADQLHQIDGLLRQGWDKSWHVVLWQSYDFGVDVMFGDHEHAMYLLWFERCDVVDEADESLPWRAVQDHAGIVDLCNTTEQEDYLRHIAEIHAAIGRGDVYQINYTTAWTGTAYGEPVALYQRLRERQQVPYGVLAHVPPEVNGGAAWHLGFSPELFLQLQDDGTMLTKPMKGTAPILQDGLDEARSHALQNDAKNRAENVMIVDLLRNDLGKLATVGGVAVPQAFEVNAFGSVWQMTSTVTATMRPETTVADILQAAFPCGSITGAPKRMAMQVIADLEQRKRGMYTGSIGYLEPCDGGLGFEGVWNVIIRSLSLTQQQNSPHYDLNMGIGSGIVIDSVAEDEWDECLWKARFVQQLPSAIGLMETMLVEDGVCALLDWHKQRLHHSSKALSVPVNVEQVWQDLQDACVQKYAQGRFRVKCEVLPNGEVVWTDAPLIPLQGKQRVCVSEVVLPIQDVLRRHKTTQRHVLDSVWQAAMVQDCFDGLLFNQAGYLLEGGRSNVFVQMADGRVYTPSLDLDILNGVMRQAVLHNPAQYGFEHGVQESACIDWVMLQDAAHIYMSNALRGLMEVDLLDSFDITQKHIV